MPLTLRTFYPDSDHETPIATIAELRAALPGVPRNPVLYALDGDGGSLQITYGSPDQHHAEVKRITAAGIERETFDHFNAATERFLELARGVLA